MLNRFLRAAVLLLAVSLVPAQAQAQTVPPAAPSPQKAVAAGVGGTEPSHARILLPATSPFPAIAGEPVTFSADLDGGRSPKWTLNSVQIATGLGPFTYTFSAAGTYTVTFVVLPDSLYAGSSASVVVQVRAAESKPAISAFTASPASVPFGGTSTLAWSTSGGTSYTLIPGGGVSSPSGSLLVQPTASTTYTLSVTNGAGTTQATATVVVSPVTVTIAPKPAGTSVAAGSVNTFYATLTGVGGNASQQIAWTASGGSPTSYTGPAFTWTAPANGTPVTITAASVANPSASDSFTLNAVPPATASLTTLRSAINKGESAVLNWSVSGATTQTLNGEPVEANGSRSVSPTTTTTYVLAATNAMQVQTLQTLTVKVMGILGWKRDIVYLGAREVGVVENNGSVHTTLVDSLGSPRFAVNEAGTVEGEQKYLPFGMLAWPAEKLETGKGFTGHEQTDPSGLIYMQARFYLPMWGRFASPDPARDQHFEETQSWNIYSYCQNNPVMKTDPTGMFDFKAIGDSFAAALQEHVTDPLERLNNKLAGNGWVENRYLAGADEPSVPVPIMFCGGVVPIGVSVPMPRISFDLPGPSAAAVATNGTAAPAAGGTLTFPIPGMAMSSGANGGKTDGPRFPDEKSLAKVLNTTVKDFHENIKADMKTDFKAEIKKIGSTNPDIGITKDGNIALRNPKTGKVLSTDVPVESYAR